MRLGAVPECRDLRSLVLDSYFLLEYDVQAVGSSLLHREGGRREAFKHGLKYARHWPTCGQAHASRASMLALI